MKPRAIPFSLTVVLCLLALPVVAARVSTVPLHHFYQPKSRFHFYTISTEEVATLSKDPNWRYIDVTGHVFPRHTAHTVPVYRLGKAEFGGSNHLYTVDMDEANRAVDTLGWSAEGYDINIAPTQLSGTVPLYRLHQPCIADPLVSSKKAPCVNAFGGDATILTSVEKDKNDAIAAGFQFVRIEGYVWSNPSFYPPLEVPAGAFQGLLNPPPAEHKVPHIDTKSGPDDGHIPLSLSLRDRRERPGFVDYELVVNNADRIPRDWFETLTVLPAEGCWGGRPSQARLVLEIGWGAASRADRRGECRPISSRSELAKFTYALAQKTGTAKSVQIILHDRLTNIRHTSNVVPVVSFGVDQYLGPSGCKRFLGRADEFLCETATGMAACNNLKNAGKVRECHATAKGGK